MTTKITALVSRNQGLSSPVLACRHPGKLKAVWNLLHSEALVILKAALGI